MSIQAFTWALKATGIRSAEKFILVCMANYADEYGRCYPSIAALCANTLLDRKTIIAGMKSLTERGMIVDSGHRVGRTKQVIVYRVIGIPDALEEEPVTPVAPAKSPKNGTVPDFRGNSPVFPSKQSRFSVETVPKTGHVYIRDPSWNPQGTPTEGEGGEKTSPKPKQFEMPIGLDAHAWTRWIAYRKEIGKPLKAMSMEAAAKKLARYGSHQAAVVEQSIENGYQGLVPLKVERGHAGHATSSASYTTPKTAEQIVAEALARGEEVEEL